MTETAKEEARVVGGQVRTFLISDVRGYSRYTVERGDEAAATLAAKFAAMAREVVAAYEGQVIELRGDEALAVFSSARQALRAAVELQERCSHETMADATLPLNIGIGLDAGEAIRLEGGYRGAALNLAARLCSLAGPGEVLASDGVVHLARKVEGLEYAERGLVHLKGFADPVRAIEVLPKPEGGHPRRRPAAESHPGTYRVQLLGPFALVRDDGASDTSRWQRRVGSLFRLLAITPGKRRLREEVIELLWPDASPEAGAGNLRLLAHRLRQALGNPDPPPVLSEGDWISLHPVYRWEVDLERFEELAARVGDDVATLEEAASLLQGEPLPEDRYEDWAAPVRERVHRRWREICLRLAGLHASRGALQEATRWYERVLEGDPLNEEAVQGLLEILVKGGKRTEALRRYRQFEQRLEEELGVPPEPETVAMVAQIEERMARPVDRPKPLAVEEQRDLVPVVPTYPLLRTAPLVGRDAELGEMVATIPRSEPQVSVPMRLVLVAAEAGMGKTRLLAEVAERAREAGLLTLAGGCYEQEGRLPYGPIHDALLDYVRSQPQDMLRSQLEGLLPELVRILPELRTRLPDVPEPVTGDAESQRLRLFSTVAQVLERISRDSPVVLMLDDLHWADDASLQLLHYLLRQQELSRVVIVGAYRKEEVAIETPLAQLEAQARDAAWAQLLPLMPLEEENLKSLLSERMDGRLAKSLVTALQERSDGNPFFALQIVRLLGQEGQLVEGEEGWCLAEEAAIALPPEVREVVARRLRRLGRPERDVLTFGAVLGREFGYPALEAMWRRDEDALYAALEASVQAQVLTETEGAYAFGHPLLHEVVYDWVPSGQRVRLHRKAGLALEALYGEHAEEHAAELARHFLIGHDAQRALRYSMRAGDQAAAVFAHAEAERQYRTAAELARELDERAREAEALDKLGEGLMHTARFDEALEVLERAVELYRVDGDREGEVRATVAMADATAGKGRMGEAVTRVEQLLEAFEGASASPGHARLYAWLAEQLFGTGRYEDTLTAADRAVELARAVGDEGILAEAKLFQGTALIALGRIDDARGVLEEAVELMGRVGAVRELRGALGNLGETYLIRGELERTRRLWERMLLLAEQVGEPQGLTFAFANRSEILFYLGEWPGLRRILPSNWGSSTWPRAAGKRETGTWPRVLPWPNSTRISMRSAGRISGWQSAT